MVVRYTKSVKFEDSLQLYQEAMKSRIKARTSDSH
jgi:hypothetical protein